MKKLLISLFFLILFFTNHSLADAPGSIHEYTVDLYYANGVLASEEKIAEFDWLKISTKLKVKYPSLKQALKYGEAKLAYNASYLRSFPLSSVGMHSLTTT